MSPKPLQVLVALVCAVTLAMLRSSAAADETSSGAPTIIDVLGEKVIAVTIERPVGIERYSNIAALKNARLIKLGERYFILGTGYVAKAHEDDKAYNWARDIEMAFAWDGVVEFYIYTPEQFEKHMASVKEEAE